MSLVRHSQSEGNISMGKSDGGVDGDPAFLLKQTPAWPSRAGVLLVSDGYRKHDLTEFEHHCAQLVSALKTQPWYSANAAGIRLNIARQHVWSAEKAPGQCGKAKKTYFDSRFGFGGPCRLITGTSSLALELASAAGEYFGVGEHYFNVVVVMVQSRMYGGSREPGITPNSSIVWVSTGIPNWEATFLHELGHVVGLSDEYDYHYACNDSFTCGKGDPQTPNIALNGSVPMWVNATDTTVLPTTKNPDCKTCDPRWFSSHVASGTIGAFEGANSYHCGYYRSQFVCRMRRSKWDFCVVCQEALVDWLT